MRAPSQPDFADPWQAVHEWLQAEHTGSGPFQEAVVACCGFLDSTYRLVSSTQLDLREFEAAAETVQELCPAASVSPLLLPCLREVGAWGREPLHCVGRAPGRSSCGRARAWQDGISWARLAVSMPRELGQAESDPLSERAAPSLSSVLSVSLQRLLVLLPARAREMPCRRGSHQDLPGGQQGIRAGPRHRQPSSHSTGPLFPSLAAVSPVLQVHFGWDVVGIGTTVLGALGLFRDPAEPEAAVPLQKLACAPALLAEYFCRQADAVAHFHSRHMPDSLSGHTSGETHPMAQSPTHARSGRPTSPA